MDVRNRSGLCALDFYKTSCRYSAHMQAVEPEQMLKCPKTSSILSVIILKPFPPYEVN
jgi:hypothetical protein